MNPDFKRFQNLARRYSLVPTFQTCAADLDTPVTLYLKVSQSQPYNALLESVEGGESLGRYSFITVSDLLRFESRGNKVTVSDWNGRREFVAVDPFSELKKTFSGLKPVSLPELPRFCGGAVGMIAYEMARHFEKIPSLLPDDLSFSDSCFLFTDTCIVMDHWKHQIYLIKWNRIETHNPKKLFRQYVRAEKELARLKERIRSPLPSTQKGKTRGALPAIRSNCSKPEFYQAVEKAKEYIRAGDVIQTVLSQRFEVDLKLEPLQLYRALRSINPSPYLYLLNFKEFSIAGSSPEILVRKEGRCAMTRPIAGTRRRGETEKEDRAREKELLNDPKERAEHLMLVDLGRNDLGRVCAPGSVTVEDFMKVERYSHVMHLVSTVQGKLNGREDAFSLFRACFPAGTVTGAPKIRAMEIIEELEKVRRNVYAGSIGYFSYSGDMDMAITIRTILLNKNKIWMQAGAGIVADSVPEYEEKETRSKAAALFKAVEMAQGNFL
ncbi:MAG: anthranilate synthase component I [Elusimicrobia bacterium]|nr:anthranilate synthase component I [Elusimicrobiota bacterium]